MRLTWPKLPTCIYRIRAKGLNQDACRKARYTSAGGWNSQAYHDCARLLKRGQCPLGKGGCDG